MLPEDQHGNPGLVPSILYPPHPPEPRGLAWGSPPALLPRHTLMPGSYSKLLVCFVEGPWGDFLSFCFVSLFKIEISYFLLLDSIQ